MSTYSTMLGGVFISSLFVFFIWIKVLYSVLTSNRADLIGWKVIMTSIGLVINSISILMVMVCRIYNIFWPIDLTVFINVCYGGMITSDLFFLTSAYLGEGYKQLKWVIAALVAWFTYCLLNSFI